MSTPDTKLEIIDHDSNTYDYCTVEEFLRDNAEDEELCEQVRMMGPDDGLDVGGGAAPFVTIRFAAST